MPDDQASILLAQPETPFAEREPLTEQAGPAMVGLLPWTEGPSPFSDGASVGLGREDELTEQFLETFDELRDESFDEALAELVAETSEASSVDLRGPQSETFGDQRERLAEAHLGPIQAEAERCVERFADHLAAVDPATATEAQLDEALASFDPGPASVSPAGEQFLGGLINKVKSVARSAARVAKNVIGKIPFLGGILNKLKALIKPLLKRVLGAAIGRLPAALQQPARDLAKKIGIGEAESESFDELEDEAAEEALAEDFASSPVHVLDPESLAESFDAALAESILVPETLEQNESFGTDESLDEHADTQLEQLATARGQFINRIQSAPDGADLGPAMEQFIPAILPALRLGLRLVGRSKVVNFLAGFLAKAIGQWVGPSLSQPLSRAVVDVGLRMIGLEGDGSGELEAEAVPGILATTVEDTVRRLAEQPDHVLEDKALMQVAVSEAFEQAVAANFPASLIRPDLRMAPSIGGTFVLRHPRSPHAYKKFSRTPEIDLSTAQAGEIRTFGGTTLDAALRAHGIALPGRFRVEIFEACAGTTLPTMARMERLLGPSGTHGASSRLHPLTRAAATALLREPRLGVDVPARFLQSRHRIAVGQRFFCLRPLGQTPTTPPVPTRDNPACTSTHPSDRRMRIDLIRGQARIALYFSEPDAQKVAAALSADPASPALLKALLDALRASSRSVGRSDGAVQIPAAPAPGQSSSGPAHSEAESMWEDERGRGPQPRRRHHRHHHRLSPAQRSRLRRRIRSAVATALSAWTRSNGHEFVRAAQDARCGVTVLIGVTGLNAHGGGTSAAIRVVPGRKRP
ncbi:hypothetical protein ACWDTI_04670 [Gordonia sp. NPDC003424]